nr:protein-cysteine N-palmitoyltransferase HHAT-like isoform X4 [Rhipicephalus microplus]
MPVVAVYEEPSCQQNVQPYRWKWTPARIYHWVLSFSIPAYVMWRYASNQYSTFLVEQMPDGFKKSPYGLQKQQDVMNWGWQTTKYVITNTWQWYLLHPVLGRLTAYAAPSYMFPRYGLMPYRAAFVAFHWNLMRGHSFSLDFVRAERQNQWGHSRRRWPPYWQSLAYFVYLPTVYLGPPQNYDDYVAQLNKTRPTCTPRIVAGAIARLLRSAAHFFLMEIMIHFFYSAAMSHWSWMAHSLDLFSLVGYGMSLLFLFYVRYLFTYGFAGALANAEGIEVPPHSPCIARMHRCSHFWRYFDRGMHKWIRRYIYEPVLGGSRRAHRLILGTAVAFTFTWVWHSMHGHDGIWCALSVLGIVLEVITTEVMKWAPIKKFQGRYLASSERMREAKALLGSPHFLLTISACIFHLAELDLSLVIVRRILTGFPFPLVPILVVLYSTSHVSMDVADWEAAAVAKHKQAAS